MTRNLTLFLVGCLLYLSSFSQDPLILEQTPIQDWSEFPLYPSLIEEETGKWKPEFAYLDAISAYRITYLSDGLKVKGLSVTPKVEGDYPCIIFNRGGNRDFGALKIAHTATYLGQLASQGYVVIASQYRGNAGGEGQEEFGGAEVNDITILPTVLKEVPGANTDKIGLYGWSRGGMMTYIALTQMKGIKAAVVGGGVSDSFAVVADRPEMESGVYGELIPDYENSKEEALKARSALYWADQFPKETPILLLHGNADWRVKPEQSLNLALEFEKHRIPYRLIMFEGGDHGIREHRPEVTEQVTSWFNRFLKEEEALPDMEYHGR